MRTILLALISALCGLAVHAQDTPAPGLKLIQIAEVKGFNTPECVAVDPASKLVYVSNVQADEGEDWVDDGQAFISVMTAKGETQVLHWLDSGPRAELNAPKGMAILGERFYVADNTRLMHGPVKAGLPLETIIIPEAKQLNDVAVHDGAVYVTDTALGVIFKVNPEGGYDTLKAPQAVNGVTFHGDKMYAVSWALHDIYELDPEGKADPAPFGLAEHFESLDGIEVLDNGVFIVSDFLGDKICAVAPDRNTVTTLVELATPADIGLAREDSLLYAPQFEHDTVVVYRIEQE